MAEAPENISITQQCSEIVVQQKHDCEEVLTNGYNICFESEWIQEQIRLFVSRTLFSVEKCHKSCFHSDLVLADF